MKTNNNLENQNFDINSNEIDISKIIKEFAIWKHLITKNLLILLIILSVFGSLGYLYAKFKKPFYTAEIKFILKSDNSPNSALSGLTSLLGSSTSASSTSIERIVELVSAEKVIIDVLFTKNKFENKNDFVINQIYNRFKFNKLWEEDTVLRYFKPFKSKIPIELMNLTERKALKKIIEFLNGNEKIKGSILKKFDKKSGVISISTTTSSEILSILITKQLYQSFISFYINEASLTSNQNVDLLRRKVDSIRNELYVVQKTSAVQSDQALGVLLQQDRVNNKTLAVKEQMLTVMYAEAQKNFQVYQTTQSMNKPVFSIIEEPFSPIEPKKLNKVLYTILFAFTGCFFTLIFCRIRMYLKTF